MHVIHEPISRTKLDHCAPKYSSGHKFQTINLQATKRSASDKSYVGNKTYENRSRNLYQLITGNKSVGIHMNKQHQNKKKLLINMIHEVREHGNYT